MRGNDRVIQERSYQHRGRRPGNIQRLLLAEDMALFREGLALLLERRTGLDSIQVGSIAETERVLDGMKDKIACAIVDVDLPDGDGLALLEQLRGLPVLALTTSQSLERRSRTLDAGADEVLTVAEPVERIADAVTRLVDE